MWRKGIATIVGSNRGYFAIIKCKSLEVYNSYNKQDLSILESPEEFYPDSSTEETIYCLSKTETPPLISDSEAYIDEYHSFSMRTCFIEAIFSYKRAYAIAQVVVYLGEYYKVIKVPSNSYRQRLIQKFHTEYSQVGECEHYDVLLQRQPRWRWSPLLN